MAVNKRSVCVCVCVCLVSICCVCVQGSFYSNAVKSLITLSTVVLLGLIIAYHGLQAQVSHLLLSQQLDHCHCHHSSISQLQAIVYQVRQKK